MRSNPSSNPSPSTLHELVVIAAHDVQSCNCFMFLMIYAQFFLIVYVALVGWFHSASLVGGRSALLLLSQQRCATGTSYIRFAV